MSNIVMRSIAHEEQYLHHYPIVEYSFHGSPPKWSEAERLERQVYNAERQIIGIFEDGVAIAIAGVIPMTQNVRGKIFKMGGIAPVATLPQARRKGYARDLMKAQFKAMHEQGWTFTGLHPFRESFYERMGYVTFPQIRIANFKTANLMPLMRWDIPGEVTVTHSRDNFDVYRAYTLKKQQQIHGMSYFPPIAATRLRDKEEYWLAVARRNGEVVGMMLYKIVGFREKMQVSNLYYDDSAAKYLLLEWLARHSDQTPEIELNLPAYERAETWLSDLEIKFSTTTWITPMGRVLNIEGMNGMQAGNGSFSATITDSYCPWNEGAFLFEGRDGVLHVSRTEAATASLTMNGLSALVYGTHNPQDFGLRGWSNDLSAATLAAMQAVFPSALPHMHEAY